MPRQHSRTLFALIPITFALVKAGCSKPSPAPVPPAPTPKQNLFVLLENSGTISRIAVTNSAGTVELSETNMAVRVERADTPPGTPFPMSESDVQRLFADTLTLLPTPAATFVLYFDEASDDLNANARALIADIVRAIRERRSTSVSATGHTDTTDSATANYELGLRRAKRVGEILLMDGLSTDSLIISSHGETDLLVKTPDGVDEPRNRRVEVVVR